MTVRPDLTIDVAAAEGPGARQIAREQFIHGLLEVLHRETPAETERRLATLFGRLDAPVIRIPRRIPWRIISGIAAAVLVIGIVAFSFSTTGSALAVVQASIQASKTAGDRRYEIRVTPMGQVQEAILPRAVLDVRDPQHFVVVATAEGLGEITLGRDGRGDWAIPLNRVTDRSPPKRLLSAWMDFGPTTLMLAAVDDILLQLETGYELKRLPGESDGHGGMCDRISASRIKAEAGSPARVEVCMNGRTHIVERVEMFWDKSDVQDPTGQNDHAPGGGGPHAHDRTPSSPKGQSPQGGPGRPPPNFRKEMPPAKVVFELIPSPPHADSWFEPETHGGK